MKTILAESWQINKLYQTLLNENQVLLNHQVLPFSSWVNSNSAIVVDDFILYHAYFEIIKIKPHLEICKQLINDPVFIQQVVDFYQSLVESQVNLNKLPAETPLHIEMKQLIIACSSLMTKFHQYNELLNNRDNYNDISITAESITSRAINNFATMKSFNIIDREKFLNPTIEFYHALNIRQEIEACAQMIINKIFHAQDVNIILCAYDDSLSYLKLIFEQYNIPYCCLNEARNSKIVESFNNITLWLLDSSLSNFKSLISSPIFNNIDFNATLEYTNLFLNNINLNTPANHVKSTVDRMNHLSTFQKAHLLKCEDEFEKTRIFLLDLFSEIDNFNPLEVAYNILCSSSLVNDADERKCLVKIQSILNQIEPSRLNKDLINIVLYEIKAIKIKVNDYSNNRVMISNLNFSLPQREHLFVLNCNSKNYPGNNSLTGLFEEEYISLIDGYPSLLERSTFFNNKQRWIENDANHIIFSYATNTFEGKGLECSVEIKEMANKSPSLWKLQQNNYFAKNQHSLSKDTSSKIFFNDNKLKGSISSFEKHFSCPYSYYLYSGLKLRKVNQVKLNQAMIGSIQHACIEQAIQLFNESYASITKEQLHQIVVGQFESIKNFFVKDRKVIDSILNRCIESLSMQFEFLNDFEIHSDLSNHQTEIPFEIELFKDEQLSILLSGIIDRIDSNHNLFRIIDFKSSSKKLQFSKIEDGLQLQLLTYLYAAQHIFKQECAGIYYYSLKNENILIDAAKLSLRPYELVVYDSDDHYKNWVNQHRLNGFTTNSSIENDNNGKHIVGWNEKGISESNIKNIDQLFELLLDLYNILRTHLSNGLISCTPVEGACAFCDFKNICRYQGRVYLSNIKEEERRKGDDDNA